MKFLSLLACIAIMFQAPGQTPAYNQFTTREGISGNTVYCGVQDKKGFLWFGTDKGLSRFDGSRFEDFGVAEGLPDPEVLDLFCDAGGDLWISCFKENVCLRKNGVIYSAATEPLLAKISLKTSIVNVSEDKNGKKWISGKDYLIYSVTGDSVERKPFPTFIPTVFQMQGELFAIQPDGFFKLSETGDIIRTIPVSTPYFHPFGVFYSCVVAGDKLLVSSPHVMLFQWDGDTFRLLAENKNLSGKLIKDSRGRVWLGSPSSGAVCFDPELKNLTDFQTFLPGKRINTVIEDNQGGFWFGTIGEGVFRLRPNGTSIYSLTTSQTQVNITALGSLPEGGVLAADDRSLVYKIGKKQPVVSTLSVNDKYNKSRSIVPAGDNAFWIGSDKGLFRFENGRIKPYTRPAAIKVMITRNDSLWIGTANSIYVLPPHSNTAVNLVAERITALCIDGQGWIWAGGTAGLKCEKQQFKYNWSEQFPELKNKIIALGAGAGAFIWAVTPQHGLLRIRVEKGAVMQVEHFSHYFKGALKNVQSIFCEPGGRVWLATNQGIYALSPDLKTQYFGIHDGLVNPDVNCILVSRDTLWAGTVAGITAIPLTTVGQVAQVPVLLSAIRYRSGPTQVVQHLLDTLRASPVCKIPGNAALAELEFSVQDFNGAYGENLECVVEQMLPPFYEATYHNVYQWIINGFNSKKDTSFAEKGVLQFGMELPPGQYRIQAFGKNKTGDHTSASALITLEKPAAWHELLIFWVFFWGAAIWIVTNIITARGQFRKMSLLVAELRIQALQAQINPHFIGNSINAIQQFFYPPDAARASRYIAIFTRLLRKTMEFTDQHFIPLKEEMQYTDDYLQLARLRYEDRFIYQINCAAYLPETTPFPGMILQPLLENATIHGMNQNNMLEVVVDVFEEENRLVCTITDNGPGLHATRRTQHLRDPQHQSRGIEMLRKKIQTLNVLHKMDIQMALTDRSDSDPSQHGTVVSISFTPKSRHIL